MWYSETGSSVKIYRIISVIMSVLLIFHHSNLVHFKVSAVYRPEIYC